MSLHEEFIKSSTPQPPAARADQKAANALSEELKRIYPTILPLLAEASQENGVVLFSLKNLGDFINRQPAGIGYIDQLEGFQEIVQLCSSKDVDAKLEWILDSKGAGYMQIDLAQPFDTILGGRLQKEIGGFLVPFPSSGPNGPRPKPLSR